MKKYSKRNAFVLIISLLLNLLGFGMQTELVFADAHFAEKNVYFGFELKSKKYVEDVQATVMEFQHIKSGAKLLFLNNEDDNKVFSISFKTPPSDSTGVNHIMEHSVLCGSKNYPVKDPFLLMNKQSLKTFLNAFTASDFTMYPVASKNEKDLYNLMGVYLDAVFYPNIYIEPKIFMQEGWHYELPSKDAELTYNGIVYNEMKGNYSSADRILMHEISKSLFPDTIYQYESGGHPEDIPNLTYDQFINVHKKYYTPSNSFIYLYGNLDIEKALKFIDEKYLSKMDKKKVDSTISLQKPFDKKKIKIGAYSVEKDSDTKDRSYFALSYVVDQAVHQETVMGMAILKDLLLGGDSSPLKKALQESNLGINFYGMYDTNCIQPIFSIIGENANEKDKDQFEKVIQDILKKIAKEGFDKKLVESVFNSYEIGIRSLNSNEYKGMTYNNAVVEGWIYGQDLKITLQMDAQIKNIKNKIKDGYFENLIEKYLLNNTHASLVILKPHPGLDQEKALKMKKNLAKYKGKLSKEEIDALVKQTKELKNWQDKEDSKENLSTIPALTRKDLNTKSEEIPSIEKNEQDIKVLLHPLFTNGVNYVNLYFDSSKVPQKQLLYLKLLSNVLGEMDTNKHNYRELLDETRKYTGKMTFDATVFGKEDNSMYPKMVISMSSLNDKMPKAFDILEETINNTVFTNKDRLHEIIQSRKANIENNISGNGLGIAISRAKSYLSDIGKYDDLGNIEYYNFLCDLDKNFNKKYPEMVKNLDDVKILVFNKNNLMISYTGEEKDYSVFQESFHSFNRKTRDEKFPVQKYTFKNHVKNEGFIAPSKVQYVVKAGSFADAGYKYSGKLKVLENILNTDYLWQQIRVKGGAYGGNLSITNKNMIFYSYRDPNLKETLEAYDGVVNYLKNFNADEQEMTNFIVGTIANMDTPMSAASKGAMGDSLYICGKNQKDIQRIRDEVLATNAQDIRNCAKLLEVVLKQNYYCVVGGEEEIQKNKNLFTTVKSIINK